MNDIRKIIPTEDDDGDFNSWTHVALEKLTWSMLVNSLGYNNNFEYKEYIPPPITPPKENTSSPNSSSSPNPPLSPIFSSPPHKNQSSQSKSPPTTKKSPHSPPPVYNPSPHYLSDNFRILKISVSSSWIEIKTAYRKLARVYHPDKYDNLPEKNFSREKGNDLFKALSNAYEKLGSLEFVL